MEQHIQANLRRAASRTRTTVTVGPFLATFTPDSANPYLNYAIPVDGANPTAAEVADLVRVFHAQGRLPRLEYVSSAAPAVEAVVLGAGFAVAGRLPLMVCVPDALVNPPNLPGIEILTPISTDELFGLVSALNAAYGDDPPTPAEVAHRSRFLAEGGIALLARDSATGEAVGGGLCAVPADGATELHSVGVRVPYRRRGIAAAVTARLARLAYAAGVATVFLMAASAAEARIYARVGFHTIGEVLDLRAE
ncbi:MAG: GNAT family N-acetyltransferase [Ktedonobacterales bacterium]|nr:GNAT family N-acetyltransferase [Ktedonobacterales bacterium]